MIDEFPNIDTKSIVVCVVPFLYALLEFMLDMLFVEFDVDAYPVGELRWAGEVDNSSVEEGCYRLGFRLLGSQL